MKFWYVYDNIFMEHDLYELPYNFGHKKIKILIHTMYFWLLLPQRLKTGFVLQGHIYLIFYLKKINKKILTREWLTQVKILIKKSIKTILTELTRLWIQMVTLASCNYKMKTKSLLWKIDVKRNVHCVMNSQCYLNIIALNPIKV